jgi:hypothetical protein
LREGRDDGIQSQCFFKLLSCSKTYKREKRKEVSRDFETSLKERPTRMNQINTSTSQKLEEVNQHKHKLKAQRNKLIKIVKKKKKTSRLKISHLGQRNTKIPQTLLEGRRKQWSLIPTSFDLFLLCSKTYRKEKKM